MRVIVEDGTDRITIDGGTVTKSGTVPWDGTGIAARLIKSAPERRYTLHCAYPANKPDMHVAADGYRDFAGTDAVEDAAWSYLIKSPKVGLWHKHGTEDAGRICESYIYRGPRWVIKSANGDEHSIEAGDWLVGIIWDESVWPRVLKGEIGGVSMQGSAVRRRPSREALAGLRS